MEAGNFTNVEPGEFNQFPSNVKPGNRNEIFKKKKGSFPTSHVLRLTTSDNGKKQCTTSEIRKAGPNSVSVCGIH